MAPGSEWQLMLTFGNSPAATGWVSGMGVVTSPDGSNAVDGGGNGNGNGEGDGRCVTFFIIIVFATIL